ncbi:glycerol-3-phosphate acyltransferase [Clostridium swellfunianum]|uniref:glycerol-3-phosphate acyltransferase n=1 Tax=Clostridium swellfunianum TaxID=1367462 RepID=UPI00202E2874|nr:glycerol-3-phosphate acyltransferase [Clostridium swellfunianum]MCM0647879.1 glycerol-3-phosphate acyltransferase [Clostridium swellfunianum]
MGVLDIIITISIGYMLGCFQTAYIIGRVVKKIDIRTQGSQNAGASNVTMVLGWKFGAITAFADIFKAALAVILVGIIFPNSKELVFIAGASTVLGHIFPFFLRFRGGKGAASLIGMLLAIDIKIAAIAILTIVIITIAIDYIALGSIGMFSALPITTYAFNYPMICTIIGIGLAFLCIYKHMINIRRIMNKEESGLRKVVKNK